MNVPKRLMVEKKKLIGEVWVQWVNISAGTVTKTKTSNTCFNIVLLQTFTPTRLQK